MSTNVTLVFLLCTAICGCAPDSKNVTDYELLMRENPSCEAPAQIEVSPWGQKGASKVCNVRNGDFVAAEDGYIRVRGRYEMGKKVGVWRWYDKSGGVSKEVDYSAEGH